MTDNAARGCTDGNDAGLGRNARCRRGAALLDRLIYLSTGLALILAFIGAKLVLHFAHLHAPAVPELSTACRSR
jgi:hypothetical protein